MSFPKYKEWMGEEYRLSHKHMEGVREFIEYAQTTLQKSDIPCPCSKCRNGKLLNVENVELHLLKYRMQSDYTFWRFHGERRVPFAPRHLRIVPETVCVTKKSQEIDMFNDLIDDAIDKDALSQLFGLDDRGRTRGIGSRVSRNQALVGENLHAFEEMKMAKKEAKKKKSSGKMKEFEKRLDNVEAMITSFSSKQSSSVDTSQPSTLPSHVSSSSYFPSPQVSSTSKYNIRSTIDYGRFVGQGRGSSHPTPGAIVHHRQMLPIERKISVDFVYEGMQNEQLYLGTQSCCTTLGEVEGGFVVWPAYLLEEIEG